MKKALTFGVFDYFHLGHLRLFKQAKAYGDYLIVAVQDGECTKMYKPDQKLLYTTEERMELVEALKIVDEVIMYTHITNETIGKLGVDFDVLCLGEDHIGNRWDGVVEWCNKHNKEVVRLKRTPGISSTQLRGNFNQEKSDN